MFELLFKKTNILYEGIYSKYAKFVSKYYLVTICIPFIINLILSFGIFKVKFIQDTSEIFSLANSKAKANENYIHKLFNYDRISKDNNQFLIHQLLNQGLYAEINFHPAKNSTDNIINKTYINDIIKINNLIKNNISFFSSETNSNLFYENLCAKLRKNCSIEGEDLLFDENFLNCHNLSADDEMSDDNKIYIDTTNFKILALNYNLGSGFKYVFDNLKKCAYGNILKLRYALNEYHRNQYENDIDYVKLSKRWELEFIEFLNKLDQSRYSVSFTYSVSQSLEIELKNTMLNDLYFVITSVFCMIIIGLLVLVFDSKIVVISSILLPMCGMCCAFTGLTSAVGLLSLFDYQMCELIFLAMFVLIGKFYVNIRY